MMTKRYFISLCKMLMWMVVLMILIASCQSHKVIYAERLHSDSLTVHHMQYDSIEVRDYMSIDSKTDTVWVNRLRTEYRYRLRHDTLREVRTDTIPVIHEVEVVHKEKYIPWYARGMLWIAAFMILAIVLRK